MNPQVYISDIHGNKAAGDAVVEHIKANYPDADTYCLGDIIGYGPNPLECLELICDNDIPFINGNHEQTIVDPSLLDRVHPGHYAIFEWTRKVLEDSDYGRACIEVFKKNPSSSEIAIGSTKILLVHASPAEPIERYLLPKHADAAEAGLQVIKSILEDAFEAMGEINICFNGHTHFAGVTIFNPSPSALDPTYAYWSQVDKGEEFSLEEGNKYIINAGSVGQPRDGNAAASYCVFLPDEMKVVWHRVDYDVNQTVESLMELSKLYPDAFQARYWERLLKGE